MQKLTILQHYKSLGIWFTILLLLYGSNPILVDIISLLSPNKPIKYFLFALLFFMMLFFLKKVVRKYIYLLNLIKQ